MKQVKKIKNGVLNLIIPVLVLKFWYHCKLKERPEWKSIKIII